MQPAPIERRAEATRSVFVNVLIPSLQSKSEFFEKQARLDVGDERRAKRLEAAKVRRGGRLPRLELAPERELPKIDHVAQAFDRFLAVGPGRRERGTFRQAAARRRASERLPAAFLRLVPV